jgi:aminopeptidase N
MTDRLGALAALVACGHPLAGRSAGATSMRCSSHDALVLDKWFALQAGTATATATCCRWSSQLLSHPDFNLKNPNRARSLLFSYCSGNPGGLSPRRCGGYVFWSRRVLEIDGFNPQLAARLARALDRWSRLAEPYRSAAREAMPAWPPRPT